MTSKTNTFTCDNDCNRRIEREWTIEGPRGTATIFETHGDTWQVETTAKHGFPCTDRNTAREAFTFARSLVGTWPKEGMGATINRWSDRTPCTIIKLSPSGKAIWIQEDRSLRCDENGVSEDQDYLHLRDEDGLTYKATLRKDGSYRLVGQTQTVSIDVRAKYHDYAF